MPTPDLAAIALAPEGIRTWLGDAVAQGGATIVEPSAANGLVWTDPDDPTALGALLDAHPAIEWVQLPWAGIEPYVEVIRAHPERTWTCGKGVYAEPVAEHALALALAGLRQLGTYARASSWSRQRGVNLLGAKVVVLGGGGITGSLLRLLGPFGCDVTVVRRSPRPMEGATRVVGRTLSTTPSSAPPWWCSHWPSRPRPRASSTAAASSSWPRTPGSSTSLAAPTS